MECAVAADGSVRIGLGYVSGVRADEVAALVAAREEGGRFASLADLASRAGAGRPSLEKLAWAGACDALAGVDAGRPTRAPTARAAPRCGSSASPRPGSAGARGHPARAAARDAPAPPALRELAPWESMVADYATTGLTLGAHPMALLRERLPEGAVSCRDLETHAPRGAR